VIERIPKSESDVCITLLFCGASTGKGQHEGSASGSPQVAPQKNLTLLCGKIMEMIWIRDVAYVKRGEFTALIYASEAACQTVFDSHSERGKDDSLVTETCHLELLFVK
jgi:hypothetical protein